MSSILSNHSFGQGTTILQATAMDVIELSADQFLLAVGLTHGSVYLVRGDFSRERVSRSRVMVRTGA